ncbi:hypothetical protein BDD12DRAFT_977586 [Trichophaea hybrida]|nr:hypothetical protein BDD12DRAFT_977586 [Trichophaea hybrida]
MTWKRPHMPAFWGPMRERYGFYQPIALVCSTVGIILSFGALCSLWLWNLNDDPTSLRSKIALSGRTTSVIAICCALLRTCIAVQLGTCCMMVASLSFEKNNQCVLLRDAATMSMYRYAANVPYPMILPVLRGTLVSKKPLAICLLLVMSLVTISSQLISTILLSSTGLNPIAGGLENVSLAYGYDNSDWTFPIPTLQQKPVEFPRFAEQTATPFNILYNSTSPGISDTGPTVRALLPLRASNRSSLLYYRGNATLIDSHVICAAPEVHQLQLQHDRDRKVNLISGNFSARVLEDAVKSGDLEKYGSFSKDVGGKTDAVYNVNACAVYGGYVDGELLCPVVAHYETPVNWIYDTFPSEKVFGEAENQWWLVIRHRDVVSVEEIPILYNETGYKFNGTEWTTKLINFDSRAAAVEMTLCLSTFRPAYAAITVRAESKVREPEYSFNLDSMFQTNFMSKRLPTYNTTSALNQLGVKSDDDRERGIFTLSNYSQVSTTARNSLWAMHKQWIAVNNTGGAVSMSSDQWSAHEIYSTIFSRTIQETGTASLALQAIFSLYTANFYYDQLDRYMVFTNSTIQAVHAVIMPTTNQGLYVVSGIIGLHFLLVAVIFSLYFYSGAPKFLDQAWQTVGQLQYGDAREFLDDTCDIGDDIVGNLPLAAAKWNNLVELSKQGYGTTSINCQTAKTTGFYPLRLLQVEQSNKTAFLARRNMSAQRAFAETERPQRAELDRQTAENIQRWSVHGSSRSLLVVGKSTTR